MDDARRHLHVLDARQLRLGRDQRVHQLLQRQHPAVVVDVQRADAGREVDDAGQRVLLQVGHQGVDAEAQVQVEHQRAVLDEQVLVAVLAVGDGDLPGDSGMRCSTGVSDRRAGRCAGGCRLMRAVRERSRHAARESVSICRSCSSSSRRACFLRDAAEADGVAGLELAHLPEVGLDDGGGADEAAEAGAVGAEDDGHVAGEVDGADGVGVVVDVGGVQAGLAAVGAGPFGVGADQADAGAVGVVVDLPRGGEEHVDVFLA